MDPVIRREGLTPWGQPSFRESAAAAAGEEQDHENDPDPVVVIEHATQTVVHSEPPWLKFEVGGNASLCYYSMSDGGECANILSASLVIFEAIWYNE
jgi:hypothetical protein